MDNLASADLNESESSPNNDDIMATEEPLNEMQGINKNVYDKAGDMRNCEQQPSCSKYGDQISKPTILANTLEPWQGHKTGIAAKLMMKMGHVPGTGLGKHGTGVLEPIKAEYFPKNATLDVVMEKRALNQNFDFPDHTRSHLYREQLLNREKQKLFQGRQQLLNENAEVISKPLAEWDEHSNRFASKQMQIMGWIEGSGLGKDGKGILKPIEAERFPRGIGLDEVFEIRATRSYLPPGTIRPCKRRTSERLRNKRLQEIPPIESVQQQFRDVPPFGVDNNSQFNLIGKSPQNAHEHNNYNENSNSKKNNKSNRKRNRGNEQQRVVNEPKRVPTRIAVRSVFDLIFEQLRREESARVMLSRISLTPDVVEKPEKIAKIIIKLEDENSSDTENSDVVIENVEEICEGFEPKIIL